MNYDEIKRIASKLRNNPTPTEVILWAELRRRKLKFKFLRQHPVIYDSSNYKYFFYIPDFYCAEKRLVVELDGKIHDFQKEYDMNREEVLKGRGLRVIRIKNQELNDIKQVIKKIENALNEP